METFFVRYYTHNCLSLVWLPGIIIIPVTIPTRTHRRFRVTPFLYIRYSFPSSTFLWRRERISIFCLKDRNRNWGEVWLDEVMCGVPDEEWLVLCRSSRNIPCLLHILTNNGLLDISRETGLSMSVMIHLWQGLECIYRSRGTSESPGSGGHCLSCRNSSK